MKIKISNKSLFTFDTNKIIVRSECYDIKLKIMKPFTTRDMLFYKKGDEFGTFKGELKFSFVN